MNELILGLAIGFPLGMLVMLVLAISATRRDD